MGMTADSVFISGNLPALQVFRSSEPCSLPWAPTWRQHPSFPAPTPPSTVEQWSPTPGLQPGASPWSEPDRAAETDLLPHPLHALSPTQPICACAHAPAAHASGTPSFAHAQECACTQTSPMPPFVHTHKHMHV